MESPIMFDKFRVYQTAHLLERPELQVWRTMNERDRRAKIIIGVIDDAPFEPKQNLENTGYKIEYLGNPNTVDVVLKCHIVLCDLQGVGVALDPQKQGAFFIDEIKKNYPEKYVIAYTGGGLNASISRDAMTASDGFLKKDASIEEWRDKLDGLIVDLLDPYRVWQRQRLSLVKRNIDTFTILKLEDAFVRSIIAREPQESSSFSRMLNSGGVTGDARAIVQSMIASGLYALLTAA
jgi:hypothetical protein